MAGEKEKAINNESVIPRAPELEDELRDEDIETITGGAKNANNGEMTF
jgi:hypothetical protein